MNILAHLQELDNLVVEHTKPPVTALLRNKLAFCIEQAQARASDVERQEQTLSRQIETIDRLNYPTDRLSAGAGFCCLNISTPDRMRQKGGCCSRSAERLRAASDRSKFLPIRVVRDRVQVQNNFQHEN